MTKYIYQGLKRDFALRIAGITKHQYYYRPLAGRRGRPPSHSTLKVDEVESKIVSNTEIVDEIRSISEDPDTDYGYRKIDRKSVV